jgi:hypothetical protein
VQRVGRVVVVRRAQRGAARGVAKDERAAQHREALALGRLARRPDAAVAALDQRAREQVEVVADRVHQRLGDELRTLGAAAHERERAEVEPLERAQRREREDELRLRARAHGRVVEHE